MVERFIGYQFVFIKLEVFQSNKKDYKGIQHAKKLTIGEIK